MQKKPFPVVRSPFRDRYRGRDRLFKLVNTDHDINHEEHPDFSTGNEQRRTGNDFF